MSSDLESRFMERALELAAMGGRLVSPNPMVGAVLVKDGVIIAEGYHKKCGGPHAEVEALSALVYLEQAKGATLYVTLEPCCHFGRTPPCSDSIIKSGISKVVCSNLDPNPLVSGGGIQRLRASGIEVTTKFMEKEGEELNKRFFTRHRYKRPYIILKWAQTKDGFIARKDGSSKWISCEASRQLVHRWRAEEDGILVGTNTVIIDNPKLNVRLVEGLNPLRIIIDRTGRVPPSSEILTDGLSTLLIVGSECSGELKACPSVQIVKCKDFTLASILEKIAESGVNSLVVEGGTKILQSFISSGLWDEARIFKSQTVEFGSGLSAPDVSSNNMSCISSEQSGDDLLVQVRRS